MARRIARWLITIQDKSKTKKKKKAPNKRKKQSMSSDSNIAMSVSVDEAAGSACFVLQNGKPYALSVDIPWENAKDLVNQLSESVWAYRQLVARAQDRDRTRTSSSPIVNMSIYQRMAGETAAYDKDDTKTQAEKLAYCVLGLASEAGEVAGLMKRLIRGDYETTEITDEYITKMTAELGDCLWYISECARVLELPLEVIASKNIEKLRDRQKRDVLKGEGDNR